MSGAHYLAGPCAGISIHNVGRVLTIKDKSGREDQIMTFASYEEARDAVWVHRDRLYAKYEIESGANAAANSPALCTEASPTRKTITTEGKSHG